MEEKRQGRVLLLRNLSGSVDEEQVREICGEGVLRVFMRVCAGQAFVEFVSDSVAKEVFERLQKERVRVGGEVIEVHFSRREHVEKDCGSRVVLATVSRLLYPVDLYLIHYLFSKYGRVCRIVTFSKNPSTFQALVEFADLEAARLSIARLHGRNIYDGCNTLYIHPSNLTTLVVRVNCAKSWDYTCPPPPTYTTTHTAQNICGTTSDSSPRRINMDDISLNLQSIAGYPATNDVSYLRPQYSGHTQKDCTAYYPVTRLDAMSLFACVEIMPRELRQISFDTINPRRTPVIICYNLCENITVAKLFNLFSVYGVVVRIKIFRDKPSTCLVQFSDPLFASIAHTLLNESALEDRELQLSFSNNLEVKLPPPSSCAEDAKRTCSFLPKDQRYGAIQNLQEMQKYTRGVCAPTNTLFIAHIHNLCEEDELKQIFQQFGEIVKTKIETKKDSKIAILQFHTPANSLLALIHLHNLPLQKKQIKVAFSRTLL